MQTYFTESFLLALDAHMSIYYDKYTTRQDFLSFLSYMERSMASHWGNEPGLAFFEHNKLRVFFGQKQVKKVRKWKLDLIISRLMEGNVIIRTDYDRKRSKTRSYAYHIAFDFGQKREVFGLKIEEIDQKLADSITPKANLNDIDVRVQYELLNSSRFQIDVSSAIGWVETNYFEKRSIDLNQRMAYRRMILDLNAKRIYVVKGGKSGRIFSSYNTIKKELRSFCSIDGESLQDIDLKSSQPLFLASLLLKKFPCPESNRLYSLVTTDDIYNWFLTKAKERGTYAYNVYDGKHSCMKSYTLLTRDDSKIAFMRFIFNSSNRGQRPVYELIFKQEFPYLFSKLKQVNNLPVELQLLESKVFIPIATLFSAEGCLSVHDGLSYKPSLRSEIEKGLQLKFSAFSISGYTLV